MLKFFIPRLSTVLLLVFTVVWGWGYAQFRIYGIKKEAVQIYSKADGATSDVVFAHVPSFNDALEYRFDKHGNGVYDSWTTILRKNSPLAVTYVVEDDTGDGKPDVLALSTKDDSAVYYLRDAPKDDRGNHQMFRISNLKDASSTKHYSYFDLNLDGMFDVMQVVEGGAKTDYVLLDGHLVPEDSTRKGNWTDGYWIKDSDGQSAHVDFDYRSGAWVRTRKS